MDDSAIRGHLSVFQFLHENRREGCTVKAATHAAMKGRLDVLAFIFHNHRDVIDLVRVRGQHRQQAFPVVLPDCASICVPAWDWKDNNTDESLVAAHARQPGKPAKFNVSRQTPSNRQVQGQTLLNADQSHN